MSENFQEFCSLNFCFKKPQYVASAGSTLFVNAHSSNTRLADINGMARENKSAAGMQHTPPQDIFNAKKIILKLDLFMQSLKKMGKEMPKIESEKPIYNVNQGP